MAISRHTLAAIALAALGAGGLWFAARLPDEAPPPRASAIVTTPQRVAPETPRIVADTSHTAPIVHLPVDWTQLCRPQPWRSGGAVVVHRWRDADGVLHYGDEQPPDGARDVLTIAATVPWLAGRVDELKDWKQCSLLAVESDRMRRWYRPGLLLIGDAAHVMSPVGGNGINYAVQDAAAEEGLQGTHQDVVTDRQRSDDPLFLSVGGDQRDAGGQGFSRAQILEAQLEPVELQSTAFGAPRAEEEIGRVFEARAEQAGQAEHLALVELERDVAQRPAGEPVQGDLDLALEQVVRAGLEDLQVPSDDHAHELRLDGVTAIEIEATLAR